MSRFAIASVVSCSLVAVLASSVGSVAFADEVYVPAARAPVGAGAPAMRRPAPSRPAPRPAPPQQPDPPAPHFAKPPPSDGNVALPAPQMDRAQLRVVLRAARKRSLAAFIAYEKAGVFPSNTYEAGALNVWRDRDGHLCAAATIINQSGATELVDRVADQNNNIKLVDVKQGPLMDWILTSGLTQEEIVAIQKPFMGVSKKPMPVTALDPPVLVDQDLRTTETRRLAKIYKGIEKALVRDEAKSLDLAADRLLKHPTLAWKALGYTDGGDI